MDLSAILTYALTSVFAMEVSLPQKGFGSTKKEIILNGVKTLLKATAVETATLAGLGSNVGTNNSITAVTTLTSEFIDATVASLNKSGAFKKAAG